MPEKPIDANAMKLMGEMLQSLMPEGWGYTLLTFETEKSPGVLNYISSAQRENMKNSMRELLHKWDEVDKLGTPNLN